MTEDHRADSKDDRPDPYPNGGLLFRNKLL
jgi:hypothetical protein